MGPANSTALRTEEEDGQVKVRVDPEKCQGHTLCAMGAPEAFELSEFDGHASARFEDVPPDLEAAATEAIKRSKAKAP
jgi:ferredoxin